jgi:hypothetical protein
MIQQPRSRNIVWHKDGGTHTLTLPDVEANGVTALSGWVCRSPIPGTPTWEWAVTNMPVTAVTGMSAGYTDYQDTAITHLNRALFFWKSYGYAIDWAYRVEPVEPVEPV